MKASFFLVLVLILVILILGVATLQRGVLVLAIPLMVYLFTAIARRPEAVNLTVMREIFPDYAPQGTPISVKLTVTNQGPAIDELVVQDVLPDGVTKIGGKSSAISFLEAQGKLELEYTVEARRGEYNDYAALVYASDFLNFFEQSSVYRTAPRLIVAPRYPQLNRIKIRPFQTRGFAGPIAARQGGTGIDFWGIREYQIGDLQRQINWKLAARSYQELYVNIFEQERVADVAVILDARQRANAMTLGGSLFEHSLRAAAALAVNFLDDGNRVSLLVYGSGMYRVFPGYGKTQKDRILRTLARAKLEVNYALESLEYLPTRFFPAKSQVVIVSPLLPEDVPVIVRIRAHGYAVMVISPDPISYESATYRDSTSFAYRIADAERTFILRQLQGRGVQLVNWHIDQPLEGAIRDTLNRQPLVVPAHRTGLL